MSQDPPSDDESAPTLRAATGELPIIELDDLVQLQRYEPGPLIGKGGMGEVRQCHDRRLSRQIALKTATTTNKAELSRFVREAQVQGQLEHPGIVPVYELGVGADGAPYLAMKRVRGETLQEVLSQLRKDAANAKAKYPRRRLLQAFLSVCQAVDYAHTNGWIHRDLKPANVMLGDFGEVYVLDWGLARRVNEGDDRTTVKLEAQPGLTTPGTLMGTPGYMAPEQVMGRAADVRSDVYALGAILFEVLTHQTLAVGQGVIEVLKDTARGCDARARTRAPEMDVAPELETICVKAVHKDARQRYASVRELHDAVDRVLAGERDLELRATMAAGHASSARQAMARATTEADRELAHRAAALRELGLALALDPNHRPALEALIEVMATPTRTTPAEAEAELNAADADQNRTAGRAAFFGIFGIITFAMISSWNRMHHLWPLIGLAALGYTAAGYTAWGSWRSKHPWGLGPVWLVLTSMTLWAAYFLDGPITILPALTVAVMVGFAATARNSHVKLNVGLSLVTAVGPLVCSLVGLLPAGFRYVDEGLLLLPLERSFHPVFTTVTLVTCFGAAAVVPTVVVSQMAGVVADLNRRRVLQAWNLRQMLPPAASGAR